MKTVYIDMDNVIVDFESGIKRLSPQLQIEYQDNYDEAPGIFALMDPVPGAIEAVHLLSRSYDLYVLSTAPWLNPTAWKDKLEWIQKYFGKDPHSVLYKRLIISHHKNLNVGDFLIDDRTKNGVDRFCGTHIHFGTEAFPDWSQVIKFLLGS